MISADSVEVEVGDPPCVRLDPPESAHLPGKAAPTGGGRAVPTDGGGGPKVTANGVHDIEDRILRITGYYGYNPGYSSHKSEWEIKKQQKKNKVITWMRQFLCQVLNTVDTLLDYKFIRLL